MANIENSEYWKLYEIWTSITAQKFFTQLHVCTENHNLPGSLDRLPAVHFFVNWSLSPVQSFQKKKGSHQSTGRC
jgi:hypothetical protein